MQGTAKSRREGGQGHVFGQRFLGRMGFLAEKWTGPRNSQFSCVAMPPGGPTPNWRIVPSKPCAPLTKRMLRKIVDPYVVFGYD
jgi:hypothetical protein